MGFNPPCFGGWMGLRLWAIRFVHLGSRVVVFELFVLVVFPLHFVLRSGRLNALSESFGTASSLE
eukprot:3108243-Amphidinium_carterae.2